MSFVPVENIVLSVHPRGRGEHTPGRQGKRSVLGSSPRTRGTSLGEQRNRCRTRFIPADAGNISPVPLKGPGFTVHPRGRGEHQQQGEKAINRAGSSPRTRGTSAACICTAMARRFIPADAGNMPSTAEIQRMSAVHPRGRGEHTESAVKSLKLSGSSPRTRGTSHGRMQPRPAHRFIPADAGNMQLAPRRPPNISVHPRGRGEHSAKI